MTNPSTIDYSQPVKKKKKKKQVKQNCKEKQQFTYKGIHVTITLDLSPATLKARKA